MYLTTFAPLSKASCLEASSVLERTSFILFIIQKRPSSFVLEVVKRIFSQHNTRNGFFLVRKATVACHGYLTQISSLETDVIDPLYIQKTFFSFLCPDTRFIFIYFFVARTYPHTLEI